MEHTQELLVHQAHAVLGGRPVLGGVDLAIPKGRVLALLGASGCGKTTLLRAIAGLTPLAGGRIVLAGRDVTTLSAQLRGIGVVFQHYALFPNLTVRENIKFGVLADGHGQAEANARADDLLQLVELAAHGDKRPAQLSGGQRQRVALARALARRPALLLMDEPFSALDESFRIPLRRSFRRLQRELNQTCLVVTHDREEAFELADQVAVMFNGQIAQCASPMELWRRPASRQVADFLGAFNAFDARQAPGAWQRDSGHWMAPIAALRLEGPGGPAADDSDWRLGGRVQACYVGQQRVSVEVLADSGEALVLWVDHRDALPEPGQRATLSLSTQALHHLPA
jgi:ABC-type Fe3+/spermidine/putrescine transport system ATPase subunit